MRMNKLMINVGALAALASLSGLTASCSEGSALRLGTANYAPMPAQEVKVSTQYPRSYESVGLVEASADHMFKGNDGSAQLALEELKKQAAKLGANMVVVKNFSADQHSGGTILDGDGDLGVLFGDQSRRRLSGEAIRTR